MDPRITKLAENLINYSVDLKKGDKIYIEIAGVESLPILKELVRLSSEKGAVPHYFYNDASILRQFLKNTTKEQMEELGKLHQDIMSKMDAYISIRGYDNPFDLSDITKEKMDIYSKYYSEPVHIKTRLSKKWVVLRYPNQAMSALANQSQEAFEDFYFNVCTVDYSKMDSAMNSLKKLMEDTDKVHIKSPGTDLTFSIKGLPAVKCAGKHNIPDGEVYTAPVKNSINGVIQFNTKTIQEGKTFSNIRLEFKDGKVINAKSDSNNDALQDILNIDDGAKYVGEFAIGVNPYIKEPILDILFDEKIQGSIHMALGNSYDDCDNTNKSALHWDIILIQTKEHGGGEIYFDDKLIRKDGIFVIPELECLNPENLK